MNRATAVALAAAALTLGTAPVAHAYPSPPASQATASVTPSTILAGECTTLSGTGFAPDSTITVTDNGDPAPSAQADHDGNLSQQFCLGSDAAPGNHLIEITGAAAPAPAQRRAGLRTHAAAASLASGTISAQVILYVQGPHSLPRTDDTSVAGTAGGAASGSSGTLAFTGFPVLAAGATGLALVAVGGAVVLAGRRRTA